jgi:hypothetical protein
MKKTILGGLMAALLLSGAVGCSQYNDHRGKGDAPVANRSGEDSPKSVTNNPDGFGNVVTGCVAGAPGFRYFATTNTSDHPSSLVVQQDEKCR